MHNHVLHHVAIFCAGVHGEHRWELYETVRSAAYKVLATHPSSEIQVLTNALCRDDPREELAWRHVVELAIARGVPLVPVVLEASAEENARRVQSPDRIGVALSDPVVLEDMRLRYSIQRPAVAELVVVDVTTLKVEQAVDAIVARLDLMRADLRPATPAHLQMSS